MLVGEIERLSLCVLKEAHAALLSDRINPMRNLRGRNAAKLIDHAASIKSLGRAVAFLQAASGEEFEERQPAFPDHRHERAKLLFSRSHKSP